MTSPAHRGHQRPGGRTARVRAAVLEAALAELAAQGYPSFSLERVARRAGVNKTTLYRRWGNKENLLREAMLERGSRRVPIPDTGSLRQDLFEYADEIRTSIQDPAIQAVIRTVAGAGGHDPRLADARNDFWSERIDMASHIVRRAIARNEVPAQTDSGLLVEALIAPIYFRLLMTGGSLDRDFVRRLADLVAARATSC